MVQLSGEPTHDRWPFSSPAPLRSASPLPKCCRKAPLSLSQVEVRLAAARATASGAAAAALVASSVQLAS